MDQLGYKEIQRLFKKIAQQAMLDQDFRKLCLVDGLKALEQTAGRKVTCPYNIRFFDRDGEKVDGVDFPYVLPPFLGRTWLCGHK